MDGKSLVESLAKDFSMHKLEDLFRRKINIFKIEEEA